MSSKKDERDIDEILASIDDMLAGKDEKTSVTQERKEVVEQAARESEDALGLSSTAEQAAGTASKLQPFEPLDDNPNTAESAKADEEQATETETDKTEVDETGEDKAEIDDAAKETNEDDEQAPRPRIVLTEEFLEPSAQESLPLWAAQASTTQDEPEEVSIENESVEATHETSDKGALEVIEEANETDKMNHSPTIEVEALEEGSSEPKVEGETQEEPFTFGETPIISSQHKDEADASKTEEEHPAQESTEHEVETDGNIKDNKKGEFDAVFDVIASDDTITFDISEAMNEDTVYDIEVLDKELVEAFVHDAIQDTDEVEAKKVEYTKTVETEMENETQNALQEELVSLNPDELDPLIEAVSDEVRIKINQHLQQILPELISDALLEHLANQSDKQDD